MVGSINVARGPVEFYVDPEEKQVSPEESVQITPEVYITLLDDHSDYPKGSCCISSKSLTSRVDLPLTKDFCFVLSRVQRDNLIQWLEPR